MASLKISISIHVCTNFVTRGLFVWVIIDDDLIIMTDPFQSSVDWDFFHCAMSDPKFWPLLRVVSALCNDRLTANNRICFISSFPMIMMMNLIHSEINFGFTSSGEFFLPLKMLKEET